MLSVKQGSIKYHFLSLWYDSIWDWTPASRAILFSLSVQNPIDGKLLYLYTYKIDLWFLLAHLVS